jgi:formylglycine-generating enzyme required for sulfatase activity
MKKSSFKSLFVLAASLASTSCASSTPVSIAGTEIQECPECPTMIAMPVHSFAMGSPADEHGRSKNEGPQQHITLRPGLSISKHEITFTQWDACVTDGGCEHHADDNGWGRGSRPVIDVMWYDAQAYVAWLSAKTSKTYRLLSEAEWEFAAKGGAATTYSWGTIASHEHANYGTDECCGGHVEGRDLWSESTAPVGSFPANPLGLHDLSGNVWEWVEDCWHESHEDRPKDGGARLTGDCNFRIMKGGSWASMPVRIRGSYRDAFPPGDHGTIIGFRVARVE